MSDQDNKFGNAGASSGPKGLAGVRPIGRQFNRDTYLGAEIAKASPQAQQKIHDQLALEEGKLETLEKKQRYSRAFLVLKEKDRLMQQFFSGPHPMPDDPAARKSAYEDIAASAARNVDARQQYVRDQIPAETERSIREILRQDGQARSGHAGGLDFDHEDGREG